MRSGSTHAKPFTDLLWQCGSDVGLRLVLWLYVLLRWQKVALGRKDLRSRPVLCDLVVKCKVSVSCPWGTDRCALACCALVARNVQHLCMRVAVHTPARPTLPHPHQPRCLLLLAPVQAFQAVRFASRQLYLHRCSSAAVTEGVRVDATSWFSPVRQACGRAWVGLNGPFLPSLQHLKR
jgi:hypothetical protein